MAAGVHDARIARAPGCVYQLGDGQGVDIGAQHDGPAFGVGFAAALDAGQHARAGDGAVFDAQCRELCGDKSGRVALLEREFGVRMQVAAEFYGIHTIRILLLQS